MHDTIDSFRLEIVMGGNDQPTPPAPPAQPGRSPIYNQAFELAKQNPPANCFGNPVCEYNAAADSARIVDDAFQSHDY